MIIISQCALCNKVGVLLQTPQGSSIFVELETIKRGDQVFDDRRHLAHFAKCPKARKPKPAVR